MVTLLSRYAPTWLVQMPWLLKPAELEQAQRLTMGVTPQRMLREMTEVLEALTVTRPLLLVLEDLHWSDPSTLDLLAALARRRGPARLLLLGTYRPEAASATGHPLHALAQELHLRGYCQTLPLSPLSPAAVAEYLAVRLPEAPQSLARLVHQCTDGNPLFMVHLVEYLAAPGFPKTPVELTAMVRSVPETLRQMIERQFARLRPEEQRLLEVGSVAGTDFTAAELAGALTTTVEQVEAWCDNLARHGLWLRAKGPQTWYDGTVSEAYGFVHALYQQVLYRG
jgi:predicted ATPase